MADIENETQFFLEDEDDDVEYNKNIDDGGLSSHEDIGKGGEEATRRRTTSPSSFPFLFLPMASKFQVSLSLLYLLYLLLFLLCTVLVLRNRGKRKGIENLNCKGTNYTTT